MSPTEVSSNGFPWTMHPLDEASMNDVSFAQLTINKDRITYSRTPASTVRDELYWDTSSKGHLIQGTHRPRKNIQGHIGRGRINIALCVAYPPLHTLIHPPVTALASFQALIRSLREGPRPSQCKGLNGMRLHFAYIGFALIPRILSLSVTPLFRPFSFLVS